MFKARHFRVAGSSSNAFEVDHGVVEILSVCVEGVIRDDAYACPSHRRVEMFGDCAGFGVEG
jgi:hypothetical protein